MKIYLCYEPPDEGGVAMYAEADCLIGPALQAIDYGECVGHGVVAEVTK